MVSKIDSKCYSRIHYDLGMQTKKSSLIIPINA